MKTEQTRRKFIMNSSKVLASIVATIYLSKFFSLSRLFGKTTTPKHLKTIDKSNTINNNKILVVYESQFGSTAEIAKFIGNNLSHKNKEVDIKKVNEVYDLTSYYKVIIGSAIQYDKWIPEARNFILKNERILSTKSVSFFLVCLVLSKNNDKAIQKVNGYATKIKNLVPNVEVNLFGKFAGVLDYSKMSFGQRILAKGIFAIIGVKEGDYRDWKAIKKWSENI